ncbi:MAG: HDOD domain-containing protein [Planctomycetes bacterium]|nr:HDOD domain-containing protein [Planctomycetota bacterium]
MTRPLDATTASRRELLAAIDSIPPLPEVTARVLTLLGRPDTEPSDIEAVLRHDPVLTGRLLAMVNSPWFGLRRAIATTREAVMVVGFRGIRTLVVATSAAKLLQRDYSIYGHDTRGMWTHAIAVAAGSKRLAQRVGLDAEESELSFVVGLLHDVGMLLLAPLLHGQPPNWNHGSAVAEVERRLLGCDHAEAGALVAERWNLGQAVRDAIASHHASGTAVPVPVAVVRIADALADECAFGFRAGHEPGTKVDPDQLATVGLQAADWPALRPELLAAMESARASLASFG